MNHPRIVIVIDSAPARPDVTDISWKFHHEGDEFGGRIERHHVLRTEHERQQIAMTPPERRAEVAQEIAEACGARTQRLVESDIQAMYRNALDTWDLMHNPEHIHRKHPTPSLDPGPLCTIEH